LTDMKLQTTREDSVKGLKKSPLQKILTGHGLINNHNTNLACSWVYMILFKKCLKPLRDKHTVNF